MRRAGGRQEAEVPMGGRLGWGEVACSAGGGVGQACVRAAPEHSGWVVASPGLGPELRVG